ncbi:MAG: winged helix-turn-helix domain-containing protein [Alphaproteobacteria bacterium]|jgi:molybdate transport system regulatory protein|nr:ModE family transcriptional regulator [Magnetovibrio sp.]HBC07258.1 ModE family transcriptional regulator [Rhodospirillaceae bacterium]HBT43044.1 ModE family transcriptional regulator [Rhodospirillaceae bacterium]HCS71616.1 ModE family transcriptional regulator [Rhodospirillaceae bacterium]|tara:strand:+ start:1185 stop:1550 length:366 start_codon:yes stop_codon:yes gene_type:complete
MKAGNQQTGARLRVVLAPDVAIGPGKADLLQGVGETGSIAAAGRDLGMSYKKAWGLIEALNAQFGTPLVTTSRGGSTRGGAELTELGHKILDQYRKMEAKTEKAIAGDLIAMRKLLPNGGE